jgi:CRP-like cAMP-binding protein
VENSRIRDNALLAALPPEERQALDAVCEPFDLRCCADLQAPGSDIDHVIFPRSGLVSLITVTRSGKEIETGVVGADGIVGGTVATGARRSVHRSMVQIEGEAWRIAADHFVNAYEKMPVLRSLTNSYQNFVLLQAQQNAACHALHDVESRLCRWLLQAQDVTGLEVLNITQEFLALMLGVRRSSVSVFASKLQQSGALQYRRGRIEILDRDRVEQCSCECHDTLRRERGIVFGTPDRGDQHQKPQQQQQQQQQIQPEPAAA